MQREKGGLGAVKVIRYLTVQSDYHKLQVPVDEIMYITIDGRKTKITRADGSSVLTNRSLKDVYGDLPGDVFASINRGIVVSKSYVKSEKKGILTMKDGTQFKRRVRAERKEKPAPSAAPAPVRQVQSRTLPVEELNWWLGGLPMPMCILELVYKGRSGSASFLLRYCNPAMEQLENIRFGELRDQSVADLPGIGQTKWLTIFADVAINGGVRTLEDAWDDSGRYMRIHCYQPQPRCCALVLTDLTRESKLVETLFHR